MVSSLANFHIFDKMEFLLLAKKGIDLQLVLREFTKSCYRIYNRLKWDFPFYALQFIFHIYGAARRGSRWSRSRPPRNAATGLRSYGDVLVALETYKTDEVTCRSSFTTTI